MAIFSTSNQDISDLNQLNIPEKSVIIVTGDGCKYLDNVWTYYSEIQHRNVKKSQLTINWKVDLENGYYLTDDIYSELLMSLKDFIFCSKNGINRNGTALKVSTLIKTFKSLIPLIKWMVSEGISQLSEIDSEKVMKYLTYLRMSNSRYGKPISDGEIFKRLDVINEIWKNGKYISNGLKTNPFPNETPYQLSGISKIKQAQSKFNFIPDDIAISLTTIAVDYVDNLSKNILDAYEAVSLAYEVTLLKNSKAEADRQARKVANRFGYKYVKDVTTDYGNLRTACYVVIAMFSGIRDSEVSSLDIGCSSKDIIEGYNWINGFVYKTGNQKIPARWMVPPIVERAVSVAEKLTSRLRQEVEIQLDALEKDINAPLTSGNKLNSLKMEHDELAKVKNSLWLVKSSKSGNSISSNKTINQQLINFVNIHNIPYHNGKAWAIHPHQFRRTFVRFMVKNSMNLRYLQEHFKHISLDMTAWYDIEDIALTEDIINYYNELTRDTLKNIVNSDHLAGKGGELVIQNRKMSFEGMIVDSRNKLIDAMADTVTLRSTGVSWCLGDIENGHCSGVHGCMIDPSNVNKCSQAIITEDHLPVWREMKYENEKLLELDSIGEVQKLAIKSFVDTVIEPVVNSLAK